MHSVAINDDGELMRQDGKGRSECNCCVNLGKIFTNQEPENQQQQLFDYLCEMSGSTTNQSEA